MKIVYKEQTKEFKNGENCTAIEYPWGDKDINGAVIVLTGRYPAVDRVVNSKCKEMVYVIHGSGKLVLEGKTIALKEGDLVLVEPGEKYFWDGQMTLFTPCTPAWSPNQHKEIE